MKRKISVSVPSELVAEAEAAVAAGRVSSVSAYVRQALAERVRHDQLVAILDDMDRESGPAGGRAEAWARQVLGL